MANHIKYLEDNISDNARIIIYSEDNKWAYMYPDYIKIRMSTAQKLIKKLDLCGIPGYKDDRNQPAGSYMYVFKQNLSYYGK